MYQIRVDTALSGEECLEKLKTNHYHLILMDQMMPIMDGIETTKRIRALPQKELRDIPIIALTANAIRGSREMFLTNGFQDYISKPMDISVLESVLRKFLPGDFIRIVSRKNPKVPIGRPISIPQVDVAKGIENYGNSRTRYIQILKYIYDDGGGQIERMRKQIAEKKYNDYIFDAHALKGLASGIGAFHLSELAKAQEYAAREKNYTIINEGAEILLEQYQMLLANIKYVLVESGVELQETIHISDKELSNAEFTAQLLSVMGSLDMLEQQEAEKKILTLLSYRMAVEKREALEKTREAIRNFDYDEVKGIIQELLQL